MLKIFRHLDLPLIAASVLLALLGLLMIYSISLSPGTDRFLWMRQLVALVIGLLGLFFLARMDYHFFERNANLFYVIAVLLLVGVLFFGLEIRGSRRWFDLGLVNFQPSEFSKFALIVLMAKFFQKHGKLTQKFRYVLWSAALVGVPALLILLEPDLGSAAIHVAVWLGMLLISPMPKRYFLYLLVIFLVLMAVAWQFLLVDYQKDRVRSFLDPTADPLGRGYNVIQSIVAVGSGGLFGRGLARGLQSQLRFLPERQTDFIFASTVEELGLIGGGLLLFLMFFVLYRLIGIVRSARDSFAMYFAAGIFFLFLVQAAVNVGMNLGLVPVTGVTLPFLSYGGSSLVVVFWLVGAAESIARHSRPVRF